RAGADARETGVAPGPLDRELFHVAVAAEDLYGLVGNLARDLRRQQLGLRDLAHWILALVPLLGGLVDERLHGSDLGPHVDELVLDDLELGDRLAERMAVAGVVRGVLEHALGSR